MPEYVNNLVKVKAPSAERLAQFISDADADDRGQYRFESWGMPVFIDDPEDYHRYCQEHWGVTRDCEPFDIHDDGDTATMSFQTDDNVPGSLFCGLSERYPDLVFELRYHVHGGSGQTNGVFEFRGGLLTESEIIDVIREEIHDHILDDIRGDDSPQTRKDEMRAWLADYIRLNLWDCTCDGFENSETFFNNSII